MKAHHLEGAEDGKMENETQQKIAGKAGISIRN